MQNGSDRAAPMPPVPDRWAKLPADWEPSSRFDGGSTGCGEMIIDLRMHFRKLGPGSLVAILAEDEGAPIEIPAWCRTTGHALVGWSHPFYLVRVRAEER
jgi:tRNA 2-thiouridine synthesizing protein A